jgi:hypothetical protein
MIVGEEAAPRDTDHGMRPAVQREGLADNVPAPAETALPERMTDDNDVFLAGHESAPRSHRAASAEAGQAMSSWGQVSKKAHFP